MRGLLKSWGRFLFVSVGIIALTSFSIDAADTITGSQTALSLFAKKVTKATCPDGMVEFQMEDKSLCIDEYEVSVGEDCLMEEPKSSKDTAINAANPKCQVVSKKGMKAWTFVAEPQALSLCAKAGKRLPTPKEWFVAALGTPDSQSDCNNAADLAKTGHYSECRSGVGAYDMIGNVWEWVDGVVEDAVLNDRGLPMEGYVSDVDEAGIAVTTSQNPSDVFNEDYFWAGNFGRYAIMRGGFYGSRTDGGIYATHAKTDPNFASNAVGFRCVKDLE